ncbi:MAG TPA: GDSL-type esterase/lipase family protein [Gammaproteobacteria bacterium]|nr:GDSL-type esterase/lipase family protein [Gammaproteobacteria bacterium]
MPQPRTDPNSALAHADLVRKAGAGVIDVYFIGDSITRRWGALDYPELLASFKRSFFGWNAADFAWGGDRTQNILWRLDHGELPRVAPKVFVVQAGTNNLGDFDSAEERVAAVAAGIEAIVERCRRYTPDALVVLTAVFPRRDKPELNASIAAINEKLAAYADGEHVRYLSINDRLVDSRGQLREELSKDGLHPSLAAYQIWADALRPILTERLGPPADRDAAPAPTGDPAAK